MRILVGKTFGIGNACLAVPMIKAIASLGHRVDLLIGTGPDDRGSRDVFDRLRNHGEFVGSIWDNGVPFDVDPHDVAVMSIPYDGRWRNGIDFFAREVIDERKRPDNVERLGFDMWKKHEVEYQMENARALGYSGPTPDGGFMQRPVWSEDLVYLGIGFKRDPGGFGLSKHFGAARYAALMKEIRHIRPSVKFVSTGWVADVFESYQIHRELQDPSFYTCKPLELTKSFEVVGGCAAYLGNDTGMMHVAASFGMPTFGLFAYPDLLVKNPPFCDMGRGLLFTPDGPPIEEVAREFVRFVWG